MKKEIYILLLVISFILFLFGCNPSIHDFTVKPEKITEGDSIQINWDVSGEPTLVVDQINDSSKKYLEFTLVVKKGNKEAYLKREVRVMEKFDFEQIVFKDTLIGGDTLLAAGDKNSRIWNDNYEIVTISSLSKRPVWVTHENKTIVLPDSTASSELSGTLLKGYWEIRSLLTIAEKNDPLIRPGKLTLQAKITEKRR